MNRGAVVEGGTFKKLPFLLRGWTEPGLRTGGFSMVIIVNIGLRKTRERTVPGTINEKLVSE